MIVNEHCVSRIKNDLRLERLRQVREQEKRISLERCQLYREKIDEYKGGKKDAARDEKKAVLAQKHDMLAQSWRKSLVDAGTAHRQARESAKETRMRQVASKAIQKKQQMVCEERERVAVTKQSDYKHAFEAVEEQKIKLLATRRELIASDREDAKKAAETRATMLAAAAARQARLDEETENGPVMINQDKGETTSSEASGVKKSHVTLKVQIMRHGTAFADKSVVVNSAGVEDGLAIKRLFKRVLDELQNKEKAKLRARTAQKSGVMVHNIEFLEAELAALQSCDRVPARLARVKNASAVPSNEEHPVVAQAFEKVFLASNRGKENMNNTLDSSSIDSTSEMGKDDDVDYEMTGNGANKEEVEAAAAKRSLAPFAHDTVVINAETDAREASPPKQQAAPIRVATVASSKKESVVRKVLSTLSSSQKQPLVATTTTSATTHEINEATHTISIPTVSTFAHLSVAGGGKASEVASLLPHFSAVPGVIRGYGLAGGDLDSSTSNTGPSSDFEKMDRLVPLESDFVSSTRHRHTPVTILRAPNEGTAFDRSFRKITASGGGGGGGGGVQDDGDDESVDSLGLDPSVLQQHFLHGSSAASSASSAAPSASFAGVSSVSALRTNQQQQPAAAPLDDSMEEDLAAQDEVELTRGSTSPMKSIRAFSPLNVDADLSSLSQLQVSFSSVSTKNTQAGKLNASWNGRETLNSNPVGKRQIVDISNASTVTARHDVHRDLDYSSYCDVSSNNSSESNYPGYGIDSRTSMSVSGEEGKDDVAFCHALTESREEDTESLIPMSTPSERAASMSKSLLNISSGLASESINRHDDHQLQLFDIGSWRSAANSSMESEGSARVNNAKLMPVSDQRLNLSQATTDSPNSTQNRSLTVRFEGVGGEGLPTHQSVSFESLFIEEEASDDSEEECEEEDEEEEGEGEDDDEGLNEVDETFVTAKQSFISSSGYSPSPSHATLTPAPPPIPYHGKIGSSGGRGLSRHFFRPTTPSNTSLPHQDTFSPEAQDEAPRLSALSLKLNAFAATIASKSIDEAQQGDLRFDVLSSTESSRAFYQDEREEEDEDERTFNLPLNPRVSSRGERYVRDDSNSNADFLFGNDVDDEEEEEDDDDEEDEEDEEAGKEVQVGNVDDSFAESSSEAKRIIESEIAEMKRRLLEVVHSSSLLGREEEAVIAASLSSSMSREADTSSPLVSSFGALEKFLTSNDDGVQIEEATNESRDVASSSRSVDEKTYADDETDMDVLLQGQSLASSAFSGMSKSHSLISSHYSANLSGGNLSSSPSRLSHTSMLSEFALRGEQSEEEEEDIRRSRFDED